MGGGRGYYGGEGDDRFTADRWFRTGDVTSMSADGCVTLHDRTKDLVKSGGEWISSVALESALATHPDVAESAVIAVAHPRWGERPLAVVVPRAGRAPAHASVVAHLAPLVAKWWLPDATVLVDRLPKTPSGKTLKTALRDRYRDHYADVSPSARSEPGPCSARRGRLG